MEPAVILFIGLFLLLASLFFYRAQKIEALEQRGMRVAAIVTTVEQQLPDGSLAAPADAGGVHLSRCDGAQPVPPPAREPGSRPGGSPQLQAVLHPAGGEDDLTESIPMRVLEIQPPLLQKLPVLGSATPSAVRAVHTLLLNSWVSPTSIPPQRSGKLAEGSNENARLRSTFSNLHPLTSL